jgi:hypothetical protein
MKNLLTIVALLCGSAMFAQSTASVKGNLETIQSNKEVGIFEFKLADATNEEVVKAAAYYKEFFTVTYNPTAQIALVKMVKNTPESRKIIVRFLVSVKNDKVLFNGATLNAMEFYEKALK